MHYDDAAGTMLANRCFLYRYLWRAFAAEPDDALLDIVADAHTREECALLDGEDGEGARLQDALAEVAAANGLGQLRSVYTKLFIGPAKLPAPPWESVYATGEPLLFQEISCASTCWHGSGLSRSGWRTVPVPGPSTRGSQSWRPSCAPATPRCWRSCWPRGRVAATAWGGAASWGT